MNILIITQSLSGGGAEKVAANLSLGLSQTENVYVLTYETLKNEYEHSGFRIDINSASTTVCGKIYQSIRRIVMLSLIKNKYRIDKSISFVPQCDYANILSSYFSKAEAVVEVSSNMSVAFPYGLSRWFRRFILSRAGKLAVVSNGSKIDLVNNWKIPTSKITTIYNSIDFKSIKARLSEEHASHMEGEYIISMGSFRKPKGHWHLIKSFACVKEQIPNLKLVILGDGAYRQKYEELAKNLGIDDSVIMPGFASNPYSYISKSVCMVFPSVYEGFGNAIIEAMICGVPVISTDCDFGPREILAPETDPSAKTNDVEYAEYGVLVPSFDMSDIDISTSISHKEMILSRAIVDLYKSIEIREHYTEKASEYCKRFANDVFTNKWISLLHK